MQFNRTTAGRGRFGLVARLEQFANDQWLADHYTQE